MKETGRKEGWAELRRRWQAEATRTHEDSGWRAGKQSEGGVATSDFRNRGDSSIVVRRGQGREWEGSTQGGFTSKDRGRKTWKRELPSHRGGQSWEGRGAPPPCSFYPFCLGLWVAAGWGLHLTVPRAWRWIACGGGWRTHECAWARPLFCCSISNGSWILLCT